jgi:LAO/AO transport system kinase
VQLNDVGSLAAAVRQGDRRALGRAITLIESRRPADRQSARELLDHLAPYAGNSIRIGISGAPGAGKSTFIESLGNHLIDEGHRVAVLAVDPSSALSGGSILGDKTRMEILSRRTEAFIRPSPSGDTLGGVARRTRETMQIVEAAGFNIVLVETVGVGQSETEVARMTDMFMLLLLPGGGDELQGIKRGIVELADLIIVNKADGDTKAPAQRTAADYRNALHLLHPRSENWQVPVESYSARDGDRTADMWAIVEAFKAAMTSSGEFEEHRAAQALDWMWSEVTDSLLDLLRHNTAVRDQVKALEAAVNAGDTSPVAAAQRLVATFLKHQ